LVRSRAKREIPRRVESARQSAERTVIGVPDSVVPGTIEWRSVIERLASYEQRPFEDVAETIRDQFVDVTQLSIASDFMIAGSVPLSAGASLLASAKAMLRAAATAAVHPRGDIANVPPAADAIADRARLAHSREGSYVIPLLMPLTEPQDDSAREPLSGMDTQRVEYEPAERRVTRTLAQALAAVQQGIVEPAREPHAQDIVSLIAAGVSRQLVVAVRSILADRAVSDFEATFQWADAITPPGGVPERVELSAAAGPLLAMAEKLLKSAPRRDPGQIVTGPIVVVQRLPDAPSGEMGIQTMRGGKVSQVRVQLSAQQFDKALEWMGQRRAVVAEGQLVRTRGQPSRIPEPTRVLPLDETFLF